MYTNLLFKYKMMGENDNFNDILKVQNNSFHLQ